MEHYTTNDFARHGNRVKSPISRRRARRLARFAIASALVVVAGLALLMLGLNGR
jgi:hypothetical protein